MTRFIIPMLCLFAFVAAYNPAMAAEEPAPTPAAAAEAAAIEAAKAKPDEQKPEEKKVEEKKEDAPAPKEAAPKEEAKDELTPEQVELKKASDEVFADTKAIAGNLPPDDQKHFFVIYSNYNMIGTVKMVQGDVGKAVQSCGEKNPELKDALDTSMKGWNDAVNPVLKQAQANIDNMVVAQNYAKPDAIKKVFKGLDKTRELSAKQIDKTPVTTKDACQYLQNKMVDTKQNFVRLLTNTLISVPRAIPNEPEAAKDKPVSKELAPTDTPAVTEPAKTEDKPAEAAPEEIKH